MKKYFVLNLEIVPFQVESLVIIWSEITGHTWCNVSHIKKSISHVHLGEKNVEGESMDLLTLIFTVGL